MRRARVVSALLLLLVVPRLAWSTAEIAVTDSRGNHVPICKAETSGEPRNWRCNESTSRFEVDAFPHDATYSASTFYVPDAAGATDTFTIYGGVGKTIRVKSISWVMGAAANTAVNVSLIKRSTADTAGTSTSPTAVPHDSNNAAAVATVKAYTVSPTLGGTVGTIRVFRSYANTTTLNPDRVEVKLSDIEQQGIVLRGTGEGLALNFNGATAPTVSTVSITWTEE